MKKSETTDPIQQELVSYSEGKLQHEVVEPLLRAMEYKDVRDRSGSNERGKDLTAIRKEGFSTSYYAIQIKKTKLSGKISAKDSLGGLLAQLHQAIDEPIIFPNEMDRRKPDQLIFITPYPMETSAASSLESSLANAKSRGVTIVDGIQLADFVREYLPEFLTGEDAYRRYSFNNSDSLAEANIALQTQRSLTIQDIYVDVYLADNRNILSSLVHSEIALNANYCVGALTDKNVTLLEKLAKSYFSFSYDVLSLDKLKSDHKELLRKSLVWPKNEKEINDFDFFAVLSAQNVFAKLIDAANRCKKTLNANNLQSASKSEIQKGFHELSEINRFLFNIVKSPFLKNLWKISIPVTKHKSIRLSSESLLYSRAPVCIIGPAGAGKTTLLKHITQIAANDTQHQAPIFIPLLYLNNHTMKEIIDYVADQLVRGGYIVEGKNKSGKPSVSKLLSSGKFRLHFDGLDEAGSHAKDAIDAIKSLHHKFPDLPIIITSRQTISIDWEGLIKFTLEPFDNKKLELFIRKWFDAQPSSQKELIQWVTSHKRLQAVAQTPLIAALLCVLYGAEIELPETEEELYSRRLELLLGQWDSAKGIRTMPKKRRDAYKLFLINLAYDMHSAQKREIPYSEALDKSKDYYREIRGPSHSIVIDCISRGLLFRNEEGYISFGHLTYQEHLAAAYLAKNNPVSEIVTLLGNSWWDKALEFYAMQMSSIDQLVRQANKYKRLEYEKNEQLKALTKYAPYTKIFVKNRA
ncbi:NACHT domain-containing protein [Porticoccus sp. W117]|uniref:NACHT domain-containing protein n=1 Tax=Porticoccus sp. W117 TaxID=3054777 RepID=UPI0025963C9B|nr:NACHT domain-containing protein [Porticoccus sp. W117]MDM3870220.1 NACHT domain-containing protein [Porticoccus sp. W117]